MRAGPYRLLPDWGQIAFVTAIFAWIVWYYFDALAASPNVQNMLLIRPAAVVAAILYLVIVYDALNVTRAADRPMAGEAPESRAPFDFRAPAIALLLCIYVLVLDPLGFDIATFGFVALCMLAAGERRILFLLGFSAIFAAALSFLFRSALSTPVPTTLF